MKRILLSIGMTLLLVSSGFGQVDVNDASTITIDFTTTVSGVNNGAFLGTGFASSPSAGQLDADAWATTGFSDGSKAFGVENTSGDHSRGTSTGGVGSGGLYSFDVGSSDPAIGFQGTGGDFTPGTIILKITNSSGSIITSLDVAYEAWVFNDQGRANSLNFSHSSDNLSYTSEASLDLTSTATADGAPAWVKTDKSITLSGLTIANGADYYIRWSSDDVSGSGSRDEFAIDDIVLTPTLEAAGAPSKFAVTTINSGSSPSTATSFDVVVQLQDDSDNPVNATQDTSVTLSVGSGTGTLGGTVTGTISSGNNTTTISGVTYDTAESGVQITATNTGGSLTAGTSSSVEVLDDADQLVLVSAPTSGTTDLSLTSFTVEARRSGDSSVDLNYTKSITITKASGTGTLGGTTSKSASSGVSTFDDLTFDTAGDFTIQAGDGSLTSSASATITISDPEPSLLIISGVYDGQVSSQPKGVELFVTADIADLSSYGLGAANNGGGTDGQEFTFPADAATAGTFIYVASSTSGFNTFFGFDVDYTDGDLGINGDDAIELFKDGVVADVFGDINTDGTGQDWEYEDGWAYRKNTETVSTTFNSADWTFSGNDGLDNAVNASATTPFPSMEYTNGFFKTIQGDAGWRLLSIPVTGGIVTDVSDDTPVQGVSGGSNSEHSSNFKLYQSGSSFTDPTNVTTTWGDGFGFALYFYDNTSASSSELPVSLDASGSEPGSDVAVTLNTTASGSTAGSGASDSKYTLVGNPFASNYNLNSVTVTGDGIQNNVQFWDDGSSSYSAQDRTTPYIVSPWQGFWVEVTSANSTTGITFPTSGKTSTTTSGTFFSKEVKNRGDISFSLSSDESYDEAIRLSFRDYATLDFDLADASKLNPLAATYATMAFSSNDRLKAVESLPYDLEETVELKLEEQLVGVSGEFTLDWSGLETIPADWTLTFHDFDEGTNVDMREVSEYTFSAEAEDKEKVNPLSILNGAAAQTMKSKSSGNTRFGITLQPNTSVSNEDGEIPLSFGLEQNYPNPFNPSTTINYSIAKGGQVSLSVYNLMGQKVAELVNEVKGEGSYNVSWNASGAASGMYYYRLEAGSQTQTRKMTLIK